MNSYKFGTVNIQGKRTVVVDGVGFRPDLVVLYPTSSNNAFGYVENPEDGSHKDFTVWPGNYGVYTPNDDGFSFTWDGTTFGGAYEQNYIAVKF